LHQSPDFQNKLMHGKEVPYNISDKCLSIFQVKCDFLLLIELEMPVSDPFAVSPNCVFKGKEHFRFCLLSKLFKTAYIPPHKRLISGIETTKQSDDEAFYNEPIQDPWGIFIPDTMLVSSKIAIAITSTIVHHTTGLGPMGNVDDHHYWCCTKMQLQIRQEHADAIKDKQDLNQLWKERLSHVSRASVKT
jgi:hypothetical protein